MLEISNIGAFTALAAGTISFLSPCVLPLVPGYISYVAGNTDGLIDPNRRMAARLVTMSLSGLFVLGFSTVFIALGAGASAISHLLLSYRYEANLIGGAIIVLFGLFMTGLLRIPLFQRELRFHIAVPGGRPVGAYLLGLAFGFGWSPCIGPVLGAILSIAALSSSAGSGIALLTIYSIGLGLPFLLAAAFTEGLAKRLKSMRRTGRILELAAGGIMVVMGIAMMTGYLTTFSFWLLATFPIFQQIG